MNSECSKNHLTEVEYYHIYICIFKATLCRNSQPMFLNENLRSVTNIHTTMCSLETKLITSKLISHSKHVRNTVIQPSHCIYTVQTQVIGRQSG